MKLAMSTLAFGCALVLTLPAIAADRAKSTPAKAKATRPAAVARVGPAETLSGRIMMVKPDQQLMVVQAARGVPFDMVVRPSDHSPERSGSRPESAGLH